MYSGNYSGNKGSLNRFMRLRCESMRFVAHFKASFVMVANPESIATVAACCFCCVC